MQAALISLTQQIDANTRTIQAQRRIVENGRSRLPYTRLNFQIPRHSTTVRGRTLDNVRGEFLRNNAAMMEMNNAVVQARQFMQGEDLRRLEEQRYTLQRNLEMVALNSWNNYSAARTAHNLAAAERPRLLRQLETIEMLYEMGDLSVVDRMAHRFAVYAALFEADAAAIALTMANAEMYYLVRGTAGF
jgi:hypothetical protein